MYTIHRWLMRSQSTTDLESSNFITALHLKKYYVYPIRLLDITCITIVTPPPPPNEKTLTVFPSGPIHYIYHYLLCFSYDYYFPS
jgi:hypothetical protein